MRYLCVLLVICTAFLQQPAWRKIQISGKAQGTTYHITWYAHDSTFGQQQIDSILQKIDTSLSIYNPQSLITRFNTSNGGVAMDDHFRAVLNKSLETYRQTNGIFDITVQPLVQAWGFGPKKINSLPDSAAIKTLKSCVSSLNLYTKGNTLFKKRSCTSIDMNGIAQGYSVDVIARFLESHGITNYLVELGGEIRVKGYKQPGMEKMKIGIEAPGENDFELSMISKIISVDSGAITTSGSYRKFYESEGKKVTHLIDPRTGYPARNELISVTVFAPDAITADAYDNALMVMGLQKALQFTEQRKDIAAHFIYRTPNGLIADTASKGFYKLMQAERRTLNEER